MATGNEVLAVAAREIGYREGAGRRNKFGAWFGLDRVAWCMEFVQWCYAQAGLPLPLKTASCGELLRWYRANQPECIVKDPVPGCIVIFDFPGTAYTTDHTGLFVGCDGYKVTTIDGNTSNGCDANGGWVQRRSRTLGYAHPTYIVPRGLKNEEEKDMKRYQTIDEIKKEAPWAAGTVAKLVGRGALAGSGQGLDLSEDMARILVINDRMGLYGGEEARVW